jgi:hypothetical protein
MAAGRRRPTNADSSVPDPSASEVSGGTTANFWGADAPRYGTTRSVRQILSQGWPEGNKLTNHGVAFWKRLPARHGPAGAATPRSEPSSSEVLSAKGRRRVHATEIPLGWGSQAAAY